MEDWGPQRTISSTRCVQCQPALCPGSAPLSWTVPLQACVQAFSSQDAALAGLSPRLCSEPQLCLHWGWALSPLSSASGLLSALTGPISPGPPSPPVSTLPPSETCKCGGRSPFPCGLHTRSKQMLGHTTLLLCRKPSCPPPPHPPFLSTDSVTEAGALTHSWHC